MADSKERDISKDIPFQKSLADSQEDNYLGNLQVVSSLVRMTVHNVFSRISRDIDDNAKRGIMKRFAKRAALVMLGRSPLYVPVKKWNEEGGIDEFCATWLSLADTDPMARMEHSFIKLFEELIDLGVYASIPGVLEEQWRWQINAIIQKYTLIFIGVSPVSQELMDADNETDE